LDLVPILTLNLHRAAVENVDDRVIREAELRAFVVREPTLLQNLDLALVEEDLHFTERQLLHFPAPDVNVRMVAVNSNAEFTID
jgi:hypothetical protein